MTVVYISGVTGPLGTCFSLADLRAQSTLSCWFPSVNICQHAWLTPDEGRTCTKWHQLQGAERARLHRGQSDPDVSQTTNCPVGATLVQHATVYLKFNKLLVTCVRSNVRACLAHETKV